MAQAVIMWTVLAALLGWFGICDGSYAETPKNKVWLDVPSQPLADALVAFSTKTDLEVFYDGALSVGLQSTTIYGEFAPRDALQLLLRGTGYVPRTLPDVGGVTIVPDTGKLNNNLVRRHQAYFAILQRSVIAGLCDIDRGSFGNGRVLINFWLEPSGVVSRADVFASSQYADNQKDISVALRRIQVSEPPADLPQPVTLAIYPPRPGDPVGCTGPVDRRGNRRHSERKDQNSTVLVFKS